MRLFEAIIDANHRAIAGDQKAGLRPAEHMEDLPVVALSCIDPRLNPLLPEVLGIPEDQFIWLRNAGNIITSPLSSTMRSLALACAVKGGKEIVIIGHTDCLVCKTTAVELLDKFKNLGVERHLLPDNISEYFGMFASERQNVIKACDFVRRSPLIGPKISVHGLLVDVATGKLEWLVNGYEVFVPASGRWTEVTKSTGETVDLLKQLADFKIGDMKFPEGKIGETVTSAADWLADKMPKPESKIGQAVSKAATEWVTDKLSESKIGDTVTKATDWLSQKLDKLEMKPMQPPADPAPPQTATNLAEKMIQAAAQQHWPKPGAEPPAPAPPPAKIPIPPRIRPKMQIRKQK